MQRSDSAVSQSWLGGVKLAAAVGIAYFLAGRLGLALRADGVAVFWPAAGIAVGALIVWGPSARLPVAAAVVVATIVCNLMIGRNAWLAIAFGSINAGQALFTAWLLERWFGSTFRLEDVHRVLGFLGASALGSAIAAVGAAIAVNLINPMASPLQVWRLWFAACSLGIVTVAPLLICLGDVMRERPTRHELIEGWVGLASITAISAFTISLPDGPWATALPEALVFPFLLWVAIRCRPVFAAAAAFLVGLTVIGSTTLSIGYFDTSKPFAERILAAQTFVLAASILAVLLAALFAERRRSERALKQGSERLRLALDGAELGAFSADLANGQLECDMRAAQSHGHALPPTTIKESRRFVHPEDLQRIDASVRAAQHTASGIWKVEYRVMPPPNHPYAGETRWVSLEGSIECNSQGTPMGLLGVTRDITERKRAERALAERNVQLAERDAQLALAGKIALVGSFTFDLGSGNMQVSPGYAAIHGLPEGTTETNRADWRARVHPGDLPRLDANLRRDIDARRSEHHCDYRIVRSGGEIRWIEARSFILYDSDGAAQRIVGANIDVTERKKAELTLAERNVQLALAGKAGLVGTYAHDINVDMMQVSEGYAALHGLPEGTTESSRSEWKRRAHPEDLARKSAVESKAFRERRGEYCVEYRIVRHGEVRWIESRSFISYDSDGSPQRIIGVNIDITERKWAEEHQGLLIAELDHRVKNVLATVNAVAGQTLETSSSMSHFVAALDGRIRSMAATHELLSTRQWRGMPMAELVRREFAAYAGSNNTKIDGPEVVLTAAAGQAMAMVLHELVTNAAKYGALSTQSGHVSVRWYRKLNGSAKLILVWQESGGPRVRAPKKSGYGTGVVRDLIPYEFGGTVDLSFLPEGVRCRLAIPLVRISTDNRNASVAERLHHAESLSALAG